MRRWGIAVLGALFVSVAAAPFLGANVGVAIWGTTGFAVAWLLFSGRAITAKRVAATALLVVVVIAVFSAVDLLGSGEQTHLGRALAGAERGRPGDAVDDRCPQGRRERPESSSTTGLTWILAAVVGLRGVRPLAAGQRLARVDGRQPALRQGGDRGNDRGRGGVLLGGLGYRDPALIALYVGVALAWLMVARLRAPIEAGRWRVTPWVSSAITLVFLALGAIAVPWVGMRMLGADARVGGRRGGHELPRAARRLRVSDSSGCCG